MRPRTPATGVQIPGRFRWPQLLKLQALVVLSLSTLISVFALARPAAAAAYFWNGQGATRNWSEGANWSTGVPPQFPASTNYEDNLFFGGLIAGIPYVTRPDLLGDVYYTGGTIRGLTFLPAAGAYIVQQAPPPAPGFNSEGIGVGIDGIVNLSPNLQTFQGAVWAEGSQTWDAGTGGLRFNSDTGYDAGTLTIKGVGAGGSVVVTGVFSASLLKTGSNKLTTTAGGNFRSLAVQGGSVELTTGGLGSTTYIDSAYVDNGASISVTNGALAKAVIGSSVLSVRNGTLNVSGAGSLLDFTPYFTGAGNTLTTIGAGGAGNLLFSASGKGKFVDLRVGDTSAGTMSIPAGSTVTSTNAILGYAATGNGSAIVTGVGARWDNSGDVLIGQVGIGSVEIRNGAAMTNFRAHVGFNSGSGGSVLVTDPGSAWTAGGSMFIGNGGAGSIQVLNGATASTAGNAYLGFSTFSTGLASVKGAGSTWNVANTLYVGGNANDPGGPFASALQIENGGSVVAGSTTLYNTGVVDLVNNATLTSPISSRGGLIRTFGNVQHAGSITLDSGNLSVATFVDGATATFSGDITGVGGLSKTGLGANARLRLTGASNYAGPTTISTGTLLVDGSITSPATVNDTATLGGSGSIGYVDVKSGGTIAPGNGLGMLTTGDVAFQSGGGLALELSTPGAGATGQQWDSLAVGGTLDLSNLTTAAPFNLRLRTVDAMSSAAPLAGWNPGIDHVWPGVVTTTGGVTGAFDSNLFSVDTTSFLSPIHGSFSLVEDGANLNLVYNSTVVDDGVLVTNLAEPLRSATPIGNNPNPVPTPEGPGAPWYWAAQSFQSDDFPRQLTSIVARVGDGSTAPAPVVVAELRADDNGVIGDLIATLTAPDVSAAPGDLTFTPDSAVTIDPNTDYWFVLGSANPGDGTFFWQYISTSFAAGTGLVGNFADSSTSGAVWAYHGNDFPYYIQVNATIAPGSNADFNGDNAVDADDLAAAVAGFGQFDGIEDLAAHGDGDANGDFIVDGADILAWQQQLDVALAVAAVQGAPEPSSAMLALLAIVALRSGGIPRATGSIARRQLALASVVCRSSTSERRGLILSRSREA